MKKATKIILSCAAAVIVTVGAVGISNAQRGIHEAGFRMNHASFGGHGRHGNRAMMMSKIITKFDVDGNGAISKAEMDSVRKSEIAKNDTNGDGKLDLNEFQTLWADLMRDMMVDHFQKLDDDGDAVVTEAEIARPMNLMMSFLDRNDDGNLSKDELRRTRHKRSHHDDDDKDDD